MADVLSQSQIDALLKSMSADAPAQETKTDKNNRIEKQDLNHGRRSADDRQIDARNDVQKF